MMKDSFIDMPMSYKKYKQYCKTELIIWFRLP